MIKMPLKRGITITVSSAVRRAGKTHVCNIIREALIAHGYDVAKMNGHKGAGTFDVCINEIHNHELDYNINTIIITKNESGGWTTTGITADTNCPYMITLTPAIVYTLLHKYLK